MLTSTSAGRLFALAAATAAAVIAVAAADSMPAELAAAADRGGGCYTETGVEYTQPRE